MYDNWKEGNKFICPFEGCRRLYMTMDTTQKHPKDVHQIVADDIESPPAMQPEGMCPLYCHAWQLISFHFHLLSISHSYPTWQSESSLRLTCRDRPTPLVCPRLACCKLLSETVAGEESSLLLTHKHTTSPSKCGSVFAAVEEGQVL